MSLTFEVISAMKSPYQLSGNTLLGTTHSISYYSSVVTISLCLSQSWTWVQFSKSNPIQSINSVTQSNPIHNDDLNADPNPIQSIWPIGGMYIK